MFFSIFQRELGEFGGWVLCVPQLAVLSGLIRSVTGYTLSFSAFTEITESKALIKSLCAAQWISDLMHSSLTDYPGCLYSPFTELKATSSEHNY